MSTLTVKQMLSGLLTDFAQSKSDAVSIEASAFEKLEKDFGEYMSEEVGELFIVEAMDKMCKSLTPSLYNYWLVIRESLSKERISLVEDDNWKWDAKKAKDTLATETLKLLKVICEDCGETPTYEDALNCCHLDNA